MVGRVLIVLIVLAMAALLAASPRGDAPVGSALPWLVGR